MFKNNKRKSYNNGMVRTVFDNKVDKTFSPMKKWYGTISTSNDSFLVQYESISRSEAVRVFQEEAKAIGGTLDKYVGTFK
jgi:hypothetical protein